SFCQFAEPGLLLLARQTDQAHQCFLPFLAFVFGPLVGSLLFAFLFALLALLLTSNRKFMASGFGLCVACLFLAVLDDRRDHVFQDGTHVAAGNESDATLRVLCGAVQRCGRSTAATLRALSWPGASPQSSRA